jgi:predicted P-loop ATPase
VELREKGEEQYFPLTDRDMKSLWRRIMLSGINCYKNELYDIMESDFSEAYNPFEEYFYNLPEWDGVTDYIGQLAATVETAKQELWLRFFPKWLVAWVAGALLKSDKPNHVMLVFRSDKQGIGKTSWFQNLSPKELGKYVAEGMPDLKDKDSILLASQKYLIICDEIGQLNGSDQYRFKARMTQKVGTARAAYRKPENL